MKTLSLFGLYCAALFFAPTQAIATTYNFSVEEQTTGITLSGYFTAVDTDNNGILQHGFDYGVYDELLDWSVTFDPGTHPFLEAFTLSACDECAVSFHYTIGATEFNEPNNDDLFIMSGPPPSRLPIIDILTPLFGDTFAGITTDLDTTGPDGYNWVWHNPVQVQLVPIPAAVWLFGSALLGVAGLKRKRRR